MSVIFSKKWFFERNEKEFLRYIHKKNGHTLTKDNLTYSFLDLDGNAYYKFPKDLALPMERMGKLHEYMMWLSAGITGQELDIMLDYADKVLTEGLTKGKNAAKIGFIISDLKERKNKIVHPELFYNIIACQIIRWDESVTEFNNDIQMEKVKAFKELNATDDTFFFEYSRVSDSIKLVEYYKGRIDRYIEKINVRPQNKPKYNGENLRSSIRRNIEDFKHNLMFIANGNIEEFNNLKKLSVEDYLLRFKKFVDDFNIKQKENAR